MIFIDRLDLFSLIYIIFVNNKKRIIYYKHTNINKLLISFIIYFFKHKIIKFNFELRSTKNFNTEWIESYLALNDFKHF